MSLIRINRPTLSQPGFGLFDDFFNRVLEETPANGQLRSWNPPIDIFENEDALVFTAELPGLEKEDLNIAVDDGVLKISGERTFGGESKELRRRERSYGKFLRTFSLPTAIEPEKIEASLKNGILTVTLPKREESKPRQISVTVQ